MTGGEFLLIVITSPRDIPGELGILEALLEAGLERLHLRKPGGSAQEMFGQLAPRWGSRVVVHGTNSRSVHSWKELKALPPGLEYAFISPVFDSISKPGYLANSALLTMPPGPYPCRAVGLGGVTAGNVGILIERGWTGAAVMGWIWEEPGKAVSRFELLKTRIDEQAKGVGGGGI